MIKRVRTREVIIGNRVIGGGNPILVQSMTKTNTRDLKKTLKQIEELEKADCEIVRVAVPDKESCRNIKIFKENIKIPIVADIHFNYKLAICALEMGVDKIRINPGNIGKRENIRKIVMKAKEKNKSIRIGINAGSLEKDLWKKYGYPGPDALVESTLRNLEIIESFGFRNIVLSIKSSSVIDTINANIMISKQTDYPIHLGITEAGPILRGTVRTTSGLSPLLYKGIGDTIRVSLTGDPVKEVKVGYQILQSLELREHGPVIISCPTCGRMEIDIEKIVKIVEEKLSKCKYNIKIAIMGCSVNGPGEARMADVGIAGGKGIGVLFKMGKIIKNVPEEELVGVLLYEIEEIAKERKKREGRMIVKRGKGESENRGNGE